MFKAPVGGSTGIGRSCIDRRDTPWDETLIPELRQEIDDLDDLKPPKDLQDDVDQLLSDVRDDLDKVKEDVNEDTAAFLNDESDPFGDAKKQANEVGLTVCREA